VPLVLVYGVSLFYLLLDQMDLPFRQLRYVILGCFSVLCCLPMLFAWLPPRTIPVAFPPYSPPAIQNTANWARENELTVSDMPWAMAWYGHRECVWLPLNVDPDFVTLNDYQKPVQVVYLTRLTLDSRFLTQWMLPREQGWGKFLLSCMVRRSQGQPGLPAFFPLHYWQGGWPEFAVFTARDRWPKELAPNPK